MKLNPPKSTTILQKCGLFLFGIFVLILFLEVTFRMAGAVLVFIQEQGNRSQFDPNEIRVLCVGDSMTALGGMNAYPRQLEEVLNSQNPQHRRYHVYNEGMVSATSSIILLNFEKNLIKFKPHIVVAMMGINDRSFFDQVQMPKFLNYFRTYKFFRMLFAHIHRNYLDYIKMHQPLLDIHSGAFSGKGNESQYFEDTTELLAAFNKQYERYFKELEKVKSPENRYALEGKMAELREAMAIRLMGTGHEYRMRGDYIRAIKYLNAAIIVAPQNFLSYVELGRCLKDQKLYKEAAGLFYKAMELYPKSIIAEMELASCYEQTGQHDKATQLYEKIAVMQSKHADVKGDVGEMLLKNKDYAIAERVISRAIKENPSDHHLYENLALLYDTQGLKVKANQYFEKARSIKSRENELKPITIENYHELTELASKHGAQFVAMQYPLRDLAYLKKIFSAKEVDAFVENRSEFQEALKSSYWSEYFVDSFGGDFGHCTLKGNRIIAENAAKIIISIAN